MALLSSSHDALPQIYFVTDGSVDDERNIWQTLKTQLMKSGSKSPRISTFGLGNISYHNWLCIVQLIQLLLKRLVMLNHVDKFSVMFLELCMRYYSLVLHLSMEIFALIAF